MDQRTILVVDPSLVVSDALESLLSPLGHRMIHEANPADGLARARRERPALIIADIPLLATDEFALVRAVQRDRQIADTPMIIWSAGYAADHISSSFVPNGGKLVALDKFCDLDLLVATVGRLVGSASRGPSAA